MTKALETQQLHLVRELLDTDEMRRIIRRMAGQIIERCPDLDRLLLAGIRTRGVPLSERLASEIERMEGTKPALGVLDITLYRDDLSVVAHQPVVRPSIFPVGIEGRDVVLCDDVLYTGRTVRAAIDELFDFGRARMVRLAVLVDRGRRELPIQADVVGKTMQTAAHEIVEVGFQETDGDDHVRLYERVES